VLDIAREICTSSSASSRLHLQPHNYQTDAIPTGVDAILFAGALHQETQASALSLFGRFFDALAPGGTAFVVDLMLDPDRTSPALSTLFQITMQLMRPDARVFSAAEAIDALRRVGFADVIERRPDSSPYRVVVARKPESR
jgi:predicted methyltransferase